MKKQSTVQKDPLDESSSFLKWGKLITRIAAIGATITGAVAAFFSTSSITNGIALTAAGASTLAATEKLPPQRYVKTRHVPPHPIPGAQRSVLQPDILSHPEQIAAKPSASRQNMNIARPPAGMQNFRRNS